MQSRFPKGRVITRKSEAGLPKLHRTKTHEKERKRLGRFRRGKTIPWHIKRGKGYSGVYFSFTRQTGMQSRPVSNSQLPDVFPGP